MATVKDNDSSSFTTGSTIIVGHVPKEISRTCWFFLQHDGEIKCEVNYWVQEELTFAPGGSGNSV